jgi:hypothetical protein
LGLCRVKVCQGNARMRRTTARRVILQGPGKPGVTPTALERRGSAALGAMETSSGCVYRLSAACPSWDSARDFSRRGYHRLPRRWMPRRLEKSLIGLDKRRS